ncbi:unnamed protein product [Agarophyton chilense]
MTLLLVRCLTGFLVLLTFIQSFQTVSSNSAPTAKVRKVVLLSDTLASASQERSDLPDYFFGFTRHENSTPQQEEKEEEDEEEEAPIENLISLAEQKISIHQNGSAAERLFRLAGLLGHSGAMSTAAALLLSGEASTTRDVSRAVHLLLTASRAGQPDAHALLGFLHASGIADRYGIAKSEAAAILHWKIAAGTGNVYSMTALGFRHLYGINLRQSCKLASEYYRWAAHEIATDARHWPTPENFLNSKPPLPEGFEDLDRERLKESDGILQSKGSDENEIVQYYRHASNRGDKVAMTALGALYYYGGYGIGPDQRHARLVLQEAAQAGGHEAHAMLGYMAMRDRKNNSAIMHIRYAAAHGNKMGHYALGMSHLHGLLGLEQDFVKAAMHFEIASKEGHAESSFQLGRLLWNGRGRDKNLEAAYAEFETAARLGSIQAKLNLGTILLSGSPPAKTADCRKGVTLLKEVAEQGEWKTLFDLASTYLGDGDEYGALYRYMQAAYVGIEVAQFNTAFMLEQSKSDELTELRHWDRERRLTEAHRLYQYSGRQGHADSLVRLGNVLYSERRDYFEAARVYGMAAELQSAEGMVAIGLMHAQGLGVQRDREMALQYLASAVDTSPEAVAPATVALVGLRVYWALLDICSRFGKWCTGSIDVMALPEELNLDEVVQKADAKRTVSPKKPAITILGSFAEDLTVVGALLLALCGILVLRGKRLARQPTVRTDRDPQG